MKYSFPNLEPVCCSMSSFNCCFLTCIQISQKADKVVFYSHVFNNFPQFVVIHTAKGFSIVNEAEVDIFVEFCCFFYDPKDVGNFLCLLCLFQIQLELLEVLSSHILLKPQLENFEHYFASI